MIRKVTLLGFLVVLALLLYLSFTLLFVRIFRVVSDMPPPATPTPQPTFTATVSPTPLVIALMTPETPTFTPTPLPTETATPTPEAAPTDPPAATPTSANAPAPTGPQVTSATGINIRSGPGTNYPVIGALSPGEALPVIGRNSQGTWWQVRLAGGQAGWVAGSVVEARDVEGVPIAQAPAPPPAPTPTSAPPTPTRPAHQYEPTGWYAAENRGLTRFLGTITDSEGNPVNGVAVEAQCGTYRVISNPSGPVGGWGRSDSMHDPPGFYDITVDRKPVVCKWILTVVYTEDGQTVLAALSQPIEVEVTLDRSVVTANWRKNW